MNAAPNRGYASRGMSLYRSLISEPCDIVHVSGCKLFSGHITYKMPIFGIHKPLLTPRIHIYPRKVVPLHSHNIKNDHIMSERDKQIEKERKGVVELLLKKNGLTRRQLVDDLVGIWAASWAHILTEEEKKQFPHLVF